MAKKITDKQIEELIDIKDWCLTILDFMTHLGGENLIYTQYKEVINDTFQKNNLKGLKYCLNDINEWAKGLSEQDLLNLDILLYNKFGKNINTPTSSKNKLNTILNRGKIKNEDEYRLLLSRVEEIYNSDKDKKEVEILNRLLAEYDR